MTEIGAIPPRALFRLLSWLSPAFPTGAFAYSHALEWAVEAGDITDAASLQDWLATLLGHGAGWSDAILLRHAHAAADTPAALGELAELGAAAAIGQERQAETLAQGAAFLLAARAWGAGIAAPAACPYPVAVGAVAARQGVAVDAICLGALHGWTANLISAGVRLVPLGQSDGLRVQAALEPVILDVCEASHAAGLDDLGGHCFRADIAAMRHETQYTRLFRS